MVSKFSMVCTKNFLTVQNSAVFKLWWSGCSYSKRIPRSTQFLPNYCYILPRQVPHQCFTTSFFPEVSSVFDSNPRGQRPCCWIFGLALSCIFGCTSPCSPGRIWPSHCNCQKGRRGRTHWVQELTQTSTASAIYNYQLFHLYKTPLNHEISKSKFSVDQNKKWNRILWLQGMIKFLHMYFAIMFHCLSCGFW